MGKIIRHLIPTGLSIRVHPGEAVLVASEGKELLIHVKQIRGQEVQLICEGPRESFQVNRIYSNAHETK